MSVFEALFFTDGSLDYVSLGGAVFLLACVIATIIAFIVKKGRMK